MFADNTLTPKEAVRLCALGMVADAPAPYSALAGGVRHFISRVAGPSLDLMGLSVELLKYEGLVAPVDGEGMEDDAVLAITDAGRRELHALLTARIRPGTDLTKLVIALKFRFLHLMAAGEQRAQVEMLMDAVDSELARLTDLRGHQQGKPGNLTAWLDHEIDALEARLAWLEDFSRGV